MSAKPLLRMRRRRDGCEVPAFRNLRSASVTPAVRSWVRMLRTGLPAGRKEMMQLMEESAADQSNPVDAARGAIWRLFQEGYVDEDMATAGLLAVDLGIRRAQRNAPLQSPGRDGIGRR